MVLQINSGNKAFRPSITLFGPEGGWDLNGYYQVKMDVTNLGDQFMQMIFRVGDPEYCQGNFTNPGVLCCKVRNNRMRKRPGMI